MTRIVTIVTMVSIVLATTSLTALSQSDLGTGQETLARELKRAWLPLESAIVASKSAGTPISAKYEIDDGAFQLSVYTMKAGSFSEVIVDYSAGMIAKVETITDAGDLASAQAQKDVLTKAIRTLAEATADVVSQHAGYRAVNAVPSLDGDHPVVEVILFNGSDWKTVTGRLD